MSEQDLLNALATARHGDPFAVLGPCSPVLGKPVEWTVRTCQPGADAVALIGVSPGPTPMDQIHPSGIFQASFPKPIGRYQLRVQRGEETRTVDDPYRFPSTLGELDHYLFAEGTHEALFNMLGAHCMFIDGVEGVRFAVWAPSASRVSVVGGFNDWDGRRHVMRRHLASGVWEIFLPEVKVGAYYKYELLANDGTLLPLKADPFAQRMEPAPGNASIVHRSQYRWDDSTWMASFGATSAHDRPVSVYEVHLGSWRKNDGRWLSYLELADTLVPYLVDMGYTHVELLPITEHPFDGSWGYQPIGLFAPTWRFGSPDDFKAFVERCHRHGLAVIVDWVPAHFPKDSFGLVNFDGTHLYEHADPRQGVHRDWDTLIFNYGRNEVSNYLIASALFWVEEYHIDALRVDAVASMLYLDYSRDQDDWIPNDQGGNENLEAVEFMRRLNVAVHARGAITIAEESTAWPMVSKPIEMGGLGYSYKWNMGWMHDTLEYMSEDPIHRPYHHDRLTFGMLYAHSESFVLPFSHDEVVHGKGSLLTRMPGDPWQQFANLRVLYGFMYAWPGKKLLFMGGEFAQAREWNVDEALDWGLLDSPWHAGVSRLVRDLNHVYRTISALHARDCDPSGFEWIDCEDKNASVIAFARRGEHPDELAIVICNFTPIPREQYRLGLPIPGQYDEVLNTNAAQYEGSGMGNTGHIHTDAIAAHGRDVS
ncbi:MAG: 1,4-alpha-glucan branching enzyme, partial [Gammaproteobacteria bacterium]